MIQRIINKLRKTINANNHKAGSKSYFEMLKHSNDANVQLVFSAVDEVNKNIFSNEEKAIFKQINELKDKYLDSDQVIIDVDFGSGKNNNNTVGSKVTNSLSQMCRLNSIPERWGQFMFKLVAKHKPENILELGACLGISAAYQTAALKQNNKGKFTTIEGAESIAAIAFESLKYIGHNSTALHIGRFTDVLPNILSTENHYDFVFIDGHHDKQATLDYFEMIYPFLSEKSIVIFDDINWSEGMNTAWKKIYNDNRILYAFDLYKCGVCIVDKRESNNTPQYFKLYLRE